MLQVTLLPEQIESPWVGRSRETTGCSWMKELEEQLRKGRDQRKRTNRRSQSSGSQEEEENMREKEKGWKDDVPN